VRWTRNTYLITADYRIRIRHDDGMRIFINDEKIYDSWQDQSATNKAFTKHIDEGYYTIIVEYYDHIGDAVAQVEILGTDQ
jgi:beta-glucosidase